MALNQRRIPACGVPHNPGPLHFRFKMSAFWIFSLRRGGAAAAGWQTIGNIDRNISFSIAEGTKELFLYTDKRNSIANI